MSTPAPPNATEVVWTHTLSVYCVLGVCGASASAFARSVQFEYLAEKPITLAPCPRVMDAGGAISLRVTCCMSDTVFPAEQIGNEQKPLRNAAHSCSQRSPWF